MEESGHYYTVYYTSLAVGFPEEKAYRHAVISQMPDEVSWLDAANMHEKEALGPLINALKSVMRSLSNLSTIDDYDTEYNLNDKRTKVLAEVRSKYEHVLHSFVYGDSASFIRKSEFQQNITEELLLRCNESSIEFGLLLHRLGDTYSHNILSKPEELFTTTSSAAYELSTSLEIGHGMDIHLPDYWFLRKKLFFQYLKKLYHILFFKSQETQPGVLPKLTFDELKYNYREILYRVFGYDESPFKHINRILDKTKFLNPRAYQSDSRTEEIKLIINHIRRQAKACLGVTMRKYAPERPPDGRKFSEFQSATGLDFSPNDVQKAIDNIENNLKEIYNREALQKALNEIPGYTIDIGKIFSGR